MDARLSRLALTATVVVALFALPLASACSSIAPALNSLTGASSSASSAVEGSYYLGIDADGCVALYKGEPGDGSDPVRTTDIVAADLHDSVLQGLQEGIVFDSFNDAIERIGDYREAAQAAAASREAEETAAREAEEAERKEAERAEAEAAAADVPFEVVVSDEPVAVDSAPAEQVASDEVAPAGEFWGVWLDTFHDLGEAYACAERAQSQGFTTEVFEVTNWDGVNYVVGTGEFATKTEAQAVLARAYEHGYTSAYLHTAARQ